MDCSGEEKAPSRPLSRSELLKRAGVAGAAAAVPAVAAGTAQAEAELAELRQIKALSPTEAATIAAFCERLIPSDATGPGAREANVIRYIDRSLAGDLSPFRAAYSAAVLAINAYAQQAFGAQFTALTPAQQDQILDDLDRNRTDRQDPTLEQIPRAASPFLPNAKAVFEMIRTHAVQGMFGDPQHGGNTNFVGWKLVRFPGPRLVISARDQRLNVTPRADLKSTYSIPLFRHLARRT